MSKIRQPMVAKKPTTKKPESPTRFIYGVGRRKTAVAQVRLYPVKKGTEAIAEINGKTTQEYFGAGYLANNALAPLSKTGLGESFRLSVKTRGGGKNGQSDAMKLGLARALLLHDAALRPILKAEGFLKRDPRMVERKKAGLKKARRAPQWAKR